MTSLASVTSNLTNFLNHLPGNCAKVLPVSRLKAGLSKVVFLDGSDPEANILYWNQLVNDNLVPHLSLVGYYYKYGQQTAVVLNNHSGQLSNIVVLFAPFWKDLSFAQQEFVALHELIHAVLKMDDGTAVKQFKITIGSIGGLNITGVTNDKRSAQLEAWLENGCQNK